MLNFIIKTPLKISSLIRLDEEKVEKLLLKQMLSKFDDKIFIQINKG